MCDRRQSPIVVCAQADALDRRRAITGRCKHMLPCKRELHGAANHLRSHYCKNDVWMGGAFRAEATTNIGRNDADALGLQSERLSNYVPNHMRALVRVIQGDAVATPPRDRCVRFERIVVLCWRSIDMIN